jgi:ribosomal protein S18 acetylase RimI-like enzyme
VIVVRPAQLRELDRVEALWTLLLLHHVTSPGLAPAASPERAVRAHLSELASDPAAALLVAERGASLAGFAALRAVRRPPLFAETERGEIEALFVRQEDRRAGVGRALVEESLRWMASRNLPRAALQVAVANAAGQAFWRALGFGDAMDVLERPL